MSVRSFGLTVGLISICLVLPAAAGAGAGGAAVEPAPVVGPPQHADGVVAIAGQRSELTGSTTLPAGTRIVIESRRAGGAWRKVQTAVSAGGSYRAMWTPKSGGSHDLIARRAVRTSEVETQSVSTTKLLVYREQKATMYGPGFWGRRTACGVKLTRSTLGVAHRTLPCGVRVSVAYRGTTIEVPVIDRGPYAAGITWDLTQAAATTLGLSGSGTVAAIRLATK